MLFKSLLEPYIVQLLGKNRFKKLFVLTSIFALFLFVFGIILNSNNRPKTMDFRKNGGSKASSEALLL